MQKLKKLKNFHEFTEIGFFLIGFLFFTLVILIKNGVHEDISTFLFNFFYFPFIFFCIGYILSGLRFYFSQNENVLIDNLFLFLGTGFFMFVLFINFTYKNLI